MADIERDQCIMNLWWLMEMHESISFALLASSSNILPTTDIYAVCVRKGQKESACVLQYRTTRRARHSY